jgi:hypothetical protein
MEGLIKTYQEKMLIEQGYDTFGLENKNRLITILAEREGLVLSQVTDEYILNHHKQLKVDILSEICESNIVKGFTASNGNTYRTNRDDQVNMIGQKDELAEDPSITVVHWKTENLGYIEHTREEWMKVYIEAFSHKKSNLFRYNSLKHKVLNATTHSEIVGINWDTSLEEVSNTEQTEPVEETQQI